MKLLCFLIELESQLYDSVKAINIPVPKLIKFVSEILINKTTQNSPVNACTHTWHIFMQG